MIRWSGPQGPLLISQVSHARLAARLAADWGFGPIAPLPYRELLIPTIRHHDDGWLDWESGPRDWHRAPSFLETSLTDSVPVWQQSVERAGTGCGQVPLRQVLTQLETAAGKGEEAIELLSHLVVADLPASVPEIHRSLGQNAPSWDQERIGRSMMVLVEAGIVRDARLFGSRRVYDWNVQREGGNPLASLLVSRHFAVLAERALEHREAARERKVATQFLAWQSELEDRLLSQGALEEFVDDVRPVAEVGLRFLRGFDRLSLWLCMGSKEPMQLSLPGSTAVEFVRGEGRDIFVSPYPFATTFYSASVDATSPDAGSIAQPLTWRFLLNR